MWPIYGEYTTSMAGHEFGWPAVPLSVLVFGMPLLANVVHGEPPDTSRPPRFERFQLVPVDEAQDDPSFLTFRKELQAAIKKRDTAALLAALHPEFKSSFGGDGGIEEFVRMWGLAEADSASSKVWHELARVLEHGGAFVPVNESRVFIAPYVSARFPDEYDSFEYAAVTGENVKVRKSPSSTGEIAATVSHEIVYVRPNRDEDKAETIGGESHPWIPVVLWNGVEGFIYGKYVRSPLGWRAGFEKQDGKWKMTFFLSGD